MNRTWINLPHADKIGANYDYNSFLLPADIFLNETFSFNSDDYNLIYQSFLTSSTIHPKTNFNHSINNQSLIDRSLSGNGLSSSFEKILLTFLMTSMAFLTVFGNSLVILAFIFEPTIRTYSNYFILNLSIADLLIGLIW